MWCTTRKQNMECGEDIKSNIVSTFRKLNCLWTLHQTLQSVYQHAFCVIQFHEAGLCFYNYLLLFVISKKLITYFETKAIIFIILHHICGEFPKECLRGL
uniref:(northern house mosquito) hypothetical protein n=1 Tax=Culex pipiens TaxID=7175 RepID=A0A8D8ITF1_CULPI